MDNELIFQLAKDKDWGIRHVIAERSDLPNEIVEQLANDGDPDVRRAICKTIRSS